MVLINVPQNSAFPGEKGQILRPGTSVRCLPDILCARSSVVLHVDGSKEIDENHRRAAVQSRIGTILVHADRFFVG